MNPTDEANTADTYDIPARPDGPLQRHEIEAWLGRALDHMTSDQVDQFHAAALAWQASPCYDRKDTEVVMNGALQHLFGDLDLPQLGNQYRVLQYELRMMTLGAVFAGKPEAKAARESTIDRMTLRRLQGKQ